ncbi:TPA_exp: Uncharacterized protein A8136_1471 [Trichophyton benhamiae CBS 112371]|uniref:Uncharacterized protein n=1 Tax=Arthroderma benhamiae (strain ATCC MYA-4681 / CBS 112371) TaxID=663331 RepID=D4AWC7_ARTBC|nr:uncharacterized protein ARB_00492 [Trichophyton benhamiae CBS 112371]EFE32667.1 hypothetical protein ARB_00492 [Trichophyton benhamiae CBS 112371]DAA75749.1 TPA_exp: Uncharacterized protein A8136_1471 [Trichophyton benhamiae CBS 112371]
MPLSPMPSAPKGSESTASAYASAAQSYNTVGPRPPFNPLPACPNPIKWDVEGRIAELQAIIDSPETKEGQKINLQAAINLYHEKKLPAIAV